MDNKELNYIKSVLDKCNGKQYLSKNNLEGFYKKVYEEFGDPLTSSDITEFLIEKGINPLNYLVSKIPCAMFFGMDLPNIVIDKIDLKLPNKIKTIEYYAFGNTSGYETIDLRGIETIEEKAFLNSFCSSIIVDGSFKYVDKSAFKNCIIKNIYIDDSKVDFEKIKQFILQNIKWEHIPHFDKIRRI